MIKKVGKNYPGYTYWEVKDKDGKIRSYGWKKGETGMKKKVVKKETDAQKLRKVKKALQGFDLRMVLNVKTVNAVRAENNLLKEKLKTLEYTADTNRQLQTQLNNLHVAASVYFNTKRVEDYDSSKSTDMSKFLRQPESVRFARLMMEHSEPQKESLSNFADMHPSLRNYL